MSFDNPRIDWFGGMEAPGGELIARYRANMRWLEGGGIDPHAAIAQSRESGLPSEADDAIPLLQRYGVARYDAPTPSTPSAHPATIDLAGQLAQALSANPVVHRLAAAIAKATR
jgi:hypothetical protein